MYAIHYDIKNKTTVKEFVRMVKTNINNVYNKETLLLIEPEDSTFKNITQLLRYFFMENHLEKEDYVTIHNFSGYDENNWQCEMIKN